jgi:hypothetical protein
MNKKNFYLIVVSMICFYFCAVSVVSSAEWIDDFEVYPVGLFPSPTWVNSGNTTAFIDNTISVSGSKSLKLFGQLGSCWAALATRKIEVQPPFIIQFYVYNGTEALSGCHSMYGTAELHTGPTWQYPWRGLITFDVDDRTGEKIIRGTYKADDPINGVDLGRYVQETWYKVQIQYEIVDPTTIRVSYWINDVFKGSYEAPSFTYENDLSYVSLLASEGSAWFDDVQVYPVLNQPPVADAGENITISSEEISLTTIQGTATDENTGDTLTYRWMEGTTVLLDWTAVGTGGECPLDLSTLSLGIGTYTLTLEVNDGQTTSTDEMILTIENSAPHAAPSGGGVYEINTDVHLAGDVSDYDGDTLTYEWKEGTDILCSGNIATNAGGMPVILPDCVISGMGIGTHTVTLEVNDGINLPVSSDIIVEIIDTTAPTLAPIASQYILWPPNHNMVDIIIEANASDNSGYVTLIASVMSNEAEEGLGDGDMTPDWTIPSIDQNTGIIILKLRAERSGRGNGRVYSIFINAIDQSGNSSKAVVEIIVPHDKNRN